MSDPILFAKKDAAVVLSEALETYRVATISAENPGGMSLAPADPRRLLLQTVLLLLTQHRQLIDYSGKQNLLRYVDRNMPIETAVYIRAMAELWGEEPIPALASECIQRFTFAPPNPGWLVRSGKRVTDGASIWEVVTTTSTLDNVHVDATVRCIVNGKASNGVAIGQINVLVDPIPNCISTENLTETIKGRDTETTEAFRERLRAVPESRSTCGPRLAYQAAALEVAAEVADAVALGPNDASEMAGTAPAPGEVHVCIIEGERDDDGNLTSVIPDPSGGLISAVDDGLSAEDVRPLTDNVITKAAEFVDFDAVATYYIARSRSESAADIQTAVEDAFAAYLLWQQSKIGRDVNPSELIARLVVAGAKRVVVTDPAFTALKRDECGRLNYEFLGYGGIEDD